jgi:EAL domain-containing protein (putative c-di-GMP-specific phosphodiesterase class I)
MRERVEQRLGRENNLRRAVEESLIPIRYQPIIELSSGRVGLLEAFAQGPATWPELSSAEAMQLAEEAGVMRELGRHVLCEALQSLAGWRGTAAIAEDLRVSVKLSSRQLDDPQLPQEILAAIAAAELPPDALRLDIAESSLVHQTPQIERLVSEVCQRGVGIHLADFGTQYSALTALQRFPVAALKIGSSFVTSLAGEEGGETIVRAIVALAHELGIGAIAEGIEKPEELDRLLAVGCDLGQGTIFTEPLDPQHVEGWLAAWSSSPPAVAQRRAGT